MPRTSVDPVSPSTNSFDDRLAHRPTPGGPETVSARQVGQPSPWSLPGEDPNGTGRRRWPREPAAPAVEDRQRESGVGRRPRLIIADDDMVVRTVLRMSLQGRFEVVGQAADAAEACELARTTHPDVALIDVEMPEGGGLRAVREISREAPGTAVVMLSTDEEESMVRTFLQAGAMAYRRKGESIDLIAKSLTMAILSHADEQEQVPTALSA